jgi:hypothetical protein
VEIDGRRFNELVRQVPEFALQVMRTLMSACAAPTLP